MQYNLGSDTAKQTRPAERASEPSHEQLRAATVLARKGRYTEAARMLRRALDAGECTEATALDLQGRMYAQQGRYLYAESCWMRAKQLDSSNTAYDEALARLRGMRNPSGHLLLWTALVASAVLLGLVLWQVAYVNPELARRQAATGASLEALHENLKQYQEASQGRVQAVAAGMQGLESSLDAFEADITNTLASLPTATEAAAHRDAVMTRFNEQVAVLQEGLLREVGALDTRLVQADSTHAQRIEAAMENLLLECMQR